MRINPKKSKKAIHDDSTRMMWDAISPKKHKFTYFMGFFIVLCALTAGAVLWFWAADAGPFKSIPVDTWIMRKINQYPFLARFIESLPSQYIDTIEESEFLDMAEESFEEFIEFINRHPLRHPFPLILGIVTGLFLLLGLRILFRHAGLTLDRYEGAVYRWKGLALPGASGRWIRTKETKDLSLFDHVEISMEEVRVSDNGQTKTTYYPVKLKGKEDYLILESRDYLEMRNLAERLANFLRHDLHDGSIGKPVVRKAGTLDESLKQRAVRTGDWGTMPKRPEYTRTETKDIKNKTVIRIPRSKFRRIQFFIFLFCVAVYTILVCLLMNADPALKPYLISLLVLTTIPFFLNVSHALYNPVITVSEKELKYVNTGSSKKPLVIFADELEELFVIHRKDDPEHDDYVPAGPLKEMFRDFRRFYSDGSLIIARSDQQVININLWIGPREAEYLRDLMHYRLIR